MVELYMIELVYVFHIVLPFEKHVSLMGSHGYVWSWPCLWRDSLKLSLPCCVVVHEMIMMSE